MILPATTPVYADRRTLYQELEAARGSKLLVYVTGDRPGMEAQIAADVSESLLEHLDTFDLPKKISLYLYSRGGDTLAAWGIVNLIRHFCDEFEVILPSKAHSAATLISLGADKVVMTKQATLSSIDPSVNTPLNPQVPGGGPKERTPVSVESAAGFLELAKTESGIKGEDNLTSVFLKLAENVHPLALGQIYRARTQIQRLARKLLSSHMKDEEKVNKIIAFTCSESGSHDYTIYRREAANELFLPVEKPTAELYQLIKDVYVNIRTELQLTNAYRPDIYLGQDKQKAYEFRRVLIESLSAGSDRFISKGTVHRVQQQTPQGLIEGFRDERTFEGWTHEDPPKNP